jgi:hypothetical protein
MVSSERVKTVPNKVGIGSGKSRKFFVTVNHFFKDISKTIITVKPGSYYTVTCILPNRVL